ncbi:MAG: type II toxin-antitoxin system RelE/ParE family toxin [Proteobacteria bacterium]|nr:type II toxin-antitoxin system RelE/ParE family toxin [Pseudomonadota bacterium]
MIGSFKNKALKRFYETGDASGVHAHHRKKIKYILTALEAIQKIEGMNAHAFNLHTLSGKYKGFYSVKVSANWRIIFTFTDGKAHAINYIDYH